MKLAEQFDKAIVSGHYSEPDRGHLGLSQIGHEDSRTVWLDFHWSLPDDLDARVLRIFRLGDLIEDEMILRLKGTHGLTVRDRDPDTGEQWRVSLMNGHVGGSMDAKILGVPGNDGTWHAFECKSAKNSEFNIAKKKGIEKWKPAYWGQVQAYLGAFNLKRALYAVYNKDTSEIYWESIPAEPEVWTKIQYDAQRILDFDEPPVSVYQPNDYRLKNFKNKFYQQVYWGEKAPSPNCRNCLHVEIGRQNGNGEWHCNRHGQVLSLTEQRDGCWEHLYMPVLLKKCATLVEDLHGQGIMRYKTNDGHEFWNCEDTTPYPGAMVFDSIAIFGLAYHDGLNKDTFADPLVNKLRSLTDGQHRPPPEFKQTFPERKHA